MKISRNWLSDFVDWIETDPNVIADRMTRSMGEVDEVTMQGTLMKDCVVAKIQTLDKHPNADKLSVCTLETDKGMKHVVCGGTNLRLGMLVAFAHVGATVKAGGKELVTLQKVKIRGEESEGMICAPEEVEIEALLPSKPEDGNRPIADLSAGAYKVGTPLRDALGLDDVIFHIDNHAITNRPDLFSHVGVARELVAMGLATWKKEPTTKTCAFPKTDLPFTIENDAKSLIPYYNGCMLTLVSIGSSPAWMQKRLIATGWRPINLVVDITNYVLLETGMPLHAFDANDFKGTLRIRASKKGEKITTLDKVERVLPEGTIVMSDDAGIFDLFGVMGGLRTSTKETTKHIFLQAGIIDPMSVRKTVIAMGHRTDAATVYEKGVMPHSSDAGLMRAIELFLQLSKGSSVSSKRVMWGTQAKQQAINVSAEKLQSFIGADIGIAKIRKILNDLGCTLKTTKDTLEVTPPVWRRDLTHEQDIAEEVARIHGYANVAPVMPDASIEPPVRDIRLHAIRDCLSETGSIEMLHLAFVSPAQMKRWNMFPADAVKIENPIGEELSLMRMTLLPSLVETAASEMKKSGTEILKVYEVGSVFRKNDEHAGLAFVVLTRGKMATQNTPLLMAKADVLRALKAAGYDATVRKGTVPLPGVAHTGRSAEILVAGNLVGHLFELHPALSATLGLPGRVAIATIGFHRLFTLLAGVMTTKPIPVFPGITLDETVPLTESRTHEAMLAALQKIDPLLENVKTVHLYEKESVKNITLRFTYRSADRTLTQEEVEKIHGKVLVELKKI